MVERLAPTSMPSFAALTSPVREFFSQGRAETTVRAYLPAQYQRVRAHVEAGDRRLGAGRKAAFAIPAAALFREALVHYLLAAEVARDEAFDDATVPAHELAMPELPPDAARPRAEPSDDARARAALASTDRLYFDTLEPEDAERSRWALERAATHARSRVEARSLAAVKGTRWGRLLAVLILLGWASFAVVKATLLPRNVALDKPVQASSLKHNPPDGHELVDGDLGTSFGIHTNTEDSPRVTIDLQADFWLQTIKVYNRVDGWYDDCLPLIVEVSKDGRTFEEIGHRDTHFGTSPPWVVDAGGRGARYVRLRVGRRSYLALSEVEVYGRKQ